MTNDLIESYRDLFSDNKVVLSTYKLANGYYYLIGLNNEIKKMFVEKGQSDNPELYDYIKIRDFYSVYLSSNKSIDTTLKKKIQNKDYNMQKKICSTNIYSLFFKNRFVQGFCSENDGGDKEAIPIEFFKEGIKKYYDSLYLIGKLQYYNKEEIDKYCTNMQNAFDMVLKDFQEEKKPKDTWIKIFLDNSEQEYERVSNFYINEKIFNKDINKVIDNTKTYGINNYNFNMNSKKPYLELKSTTYKIGSLINTEDINILRRIYIWLYNNGLNTSTLKMPQNFEFKGLEDAKQKIINENIYEIKVINDNGTAKIKNFEFVPNFSTDIVKFEFKDDLYNGQQISCATTIYELELLINNVWITHNMESKINYIRDSYYDYDERVSKAKGLSNWKKEFLRTYSESFKNLFQREDKKTFMQNLDKMATEIVQNTLIDDYSYSKNYKKNAIETMNLWICLSNYFNKKEDKVMRINDVKERAMKVFIDDKKLEEDDEYYFLVGQLAYFLLSKSKASKLTQDITDPFIKANNIDILNKELKFLYDKYNYDLSFRDKRFNNIYSQILLCKPETSVKENKDIILAGMLSENMFYIKTKGGNENEENK